MRAFVSWERPAQYFRRLRLTFEALVQAVVQARPDTEITVKYQRFVLFWVSSAGHLCFFELHDSGGSWRFCSCQVYNSDFPARYRSKREALRRKGQEWGGERFELNFAPWELPEVASPYLVTFVESFFSDCEPQDIYRWPVFDTGDFAYPFYARSRGAQEIDAVYEKKDRRGRWQAVLALEQAHAV